MHRFLFLLVISALPLIACAQKLPNRHPVRFHSIYALGVINGKASTSYSIETVQGVSWRNSFVGGGIGIDYYQFRTVPVFLQLRQQFGNGKHNVFLFGNAGHNIDWLSDNSKEMNFGERTKYKGGWYYDGGIGTKLSLRNENAFLLSAGYSFKQVRKIVYVPNCMLGSPCVEDEDRYLYSFSRIAIRIGFQF